MAFKFIHLEIPGLILIEPPIFEDGRGFFLESYEYSDFAAAGIHDQFIQDNHSKSDGTIMRGLHFQLPPSAQAKLIRCTRGEVLDVAVDIRRGSPSYGKALTVVLSEENKKILYVPVGFAHGFLTLSETAEILYKVTALYSPKDERGLIWNDRDLKIHWPDLKPKLSLKDEKWPRLKDLQSPFEYQADRKQSR